MTWKIEWANGFEFGREEAHAAAQELLADSYFLLKQAGKVTQANSRTSVGIFPGPYVETQCFSFLKNG